MKLLMHIYPSIVPVAINWPVCPCKGDTVRYNERDYVVMEVNHNIELKIIRIILRK